MLCLLIRDSLRLPRRKAVFSNAIISDRSPQYNPCLKTGRRRKVRGRRIYMRRPQQQMMGRALSVTAVTAPPEGEPWRFGRQASPFGRGAARRRRRGWPLGHGEQLGGPLSHCGDSSPRGGALETGTPSLSLRERCRPQAAERAASWVLHHSYSYRAFSLSSLAYFSAAAFSAMVNSSVARSGNWRLSEL